MVTGCSAFIKWVDWGLKGFAAVHQESFVHFFRREEDDDRCRLFLMGCHWLNLVHILLDIRFSQRLTILKLIVPL